MSKTKVIFIGDYSDVETVGLLKAFCNRYCDTFDILVSGYRPVKIQKEREITERCTVSGMNSGKFAYYKKTAEYVIITTPAAKFTKEKKKQKIVYLLSDIDEMSFAGVIGSVSCVITDSRSTSDFFSGISSQIKVTLVDDIINQSIDSLEAEIHPEEQQDYLLVSVKDDPELRGANGARLFFKSIVENNTGNIITITKSSSCDIATSNVYFNGSKATKRVLSEFTGTVVFYDEESRLYYYDYLSREEINQKDNNEEMLKAFNLKKLESDISKSIDIELNEADGEYVNYRRLIERAYEIDQCNQIKVSIIICRYNTPYNLLSRAILSALNCGHENVEVIVVDDGSESSIEIEVKEKISDSRVRYLYKENEGLGLSREYGIRKSTGKYIFYLDSDDTIHPDGMRYLVAHAEHFKLNMVIGKRVLCDERGTPLNESLKYLAGNSFCCYYGGDNSIAKIFTDVMVNNLLINKEFLKESGIRFKKGLYEDVLYSAQLYEKCPEYHYLNIVIHDWYQYGDSSTISSTPSISNMQERVSKENDAWEYIPDRLKSDRLKVIMAIDFNLYLKAYFCMEEDDRREVWNLIKDFLSDKKDYVHIDSYAEGVKELVNAILQDNRKYFEYVINRYYAAKNNNEEHDDYIVFTHYHLFVAILRALSGNRKTRLFLGQFYTKFDNRMIYRLYESGLFDSVKQFNYGPMVGNLFNELELRPGEADIVIPEYLYNPFSELFRDCDKKNDTIYIFSDTHPYWYYIEREFDNIVKLEDAYNSFDREVKTHKMTGIWSGIQAYEGKEYPLMFYRSEKISKIITSSIPQDIPEYYKKKIVVEDTKELEKKFSKELKELMIKIYDIDTSMFTEKSVLLLTQPLAQFDYCSKKQQKKLMQKMCKNIDPENLLIKPHPADQMNYKYLGGTILQKNVPIEAYNHLGVQIDKAITFGSSAIETITFANEKKHYFKLHDIEFDEVVLAIKGMLKDPKPKKKKKSLKRRVKNFAKKILGKL